jgi:hypothetical protein
MKPLAITTALAMAAAGFLALAVLASPAFAEPQTRFYGPDGRSLGTAVPQGQGSIRYYDSRGNSTGTSSTSGGTTTFYAPGGNVTGRATAPAAGRE